MNKPYPSEHTIKSLRVAWPNATRAERLKYIQKDPVWVEAAGVSLDAPYSQDAEDEMVVDDLLRIEAELKAEHEAAERGGKPS